MSNDDGNDLFRAYYFGQDRYGAWPYLAARCLRSLGFPAWTFLSMHVWLCAGVGLSAVFAGALVPDRKLAAAFAWLAVLFLHPVIRENVFMPHPYVWQLLAVMGAWWAMRQHVALACATAFLAVWLSTSSVPLLLGMTLSHGLRSKEARRGFVALGVGVAGEASLRFFYHRVALDVYAQSYRTPLRLDVGHLLDNAAEVAGRAWTLGPWWVLLASVLVAAWALVRHDGVGLAAGTAWASSLYAVLLVAVSYVRLNEYEARYFVPLLALVAWGLSVKVMEVIWAQVDGAVARVIEAGLVGATVACVAWQVPLAPVDPVVDEWAGTAKRLAAEKPGVVLVGDYWAVYALAGLAKPGDIVPVPFESQQQRTPFWKGRFEAAKDIVVVTSPGKPEHPLPSQLVQFGRTFDVEPGSHFDAYGLSLATYRQRAPTTP